MELTHLQVCRRGDPFSVMIEILSRLQIISLRLYSRSLTRMFTFSGFYFLLQKNVNTTNFDTNSITSAAVICIFAFVSGLAWCAVLIISHFIANGRPFSTSFSSFDPIFCIPSWILVLIPNCTTPRV